MKHEREQQRQGQGEAAPGADSAPRAAFELDTSLPGVQKLLRVVAFVERELRRAAREEVTTSTPGAGPGGGATGG